MAALQSSAVASQIRFSSRRSGVKAIISLPKIRTNPGSAQISLPKGLMMRTSAGTTLTKNTVTDFPDISTADSDRTAETVRKMYTITEVVADRVEMHRNIGAQRDNWNSLFLTSINSITLAATTMSGIASATAGEGSSALALHLGGVTLFVAATGLLAVMNKIQPSQLAEEQRNAARLFEQLRREIETKLALGSVTERDADEALERVLALDEAFPLPLLGAMIEKFPAKVEPAVWWLRMEKRQRKPSQLGRGMNGWSSKLEAELREVCAVIETRDVEEYLRLGEKVLKLNKFLAVSGPVLTGVAAVGTALSGHFGAVPAVAGVLGGALASVVNSVEHGGQVGMVFEMYRNNAGFFQLVKETIVTNLKERDVQRRENGQVLEMKISLLLGRSLSELKNLADRSRSRSDANNIDGSDHSEEFASKLF